MANSDSSATLDDDIWKLILTSHHISSLLRGALSLIEESGDGGGGHIFHARQIIEVALKETDSIGLREDEFKIMDRAKALETTA